MTTNENQIVVYQPNETIRLDVRLENETVWLTQSQMATLFGCSTDNVGLHLKKIYSSGELDRNSTAEESSVVQLEGHRNVSRRICFYNLDAIISVGYRVNSVLGVKFRQWATRVLRDYLLHGQAINQRLSLLEDKVDRRLAEHDRDIAELKDKVDFFVQTKEPPLQGVFYDGQLWYARAMFRMFALSVILLSSFSVFASPPSITAPPLSSFPDTEMTTNVAFNAGNDDGRIFRLSIQLNASASNNVAVAFGYDANENGVLDRAEADMLVGWDAGRWFCRDRVSGFSRAVVREDCPQQLDWKLILNARKEAKALSASDGNGVVFDESVPVTMFGSNWNLMSVTVRGIGEPGGLVVSDVSGWGLRVILR